MARMASSSQSNTRAGPVWTSISCATADCLTTQPSGARLPLSTAMPPVGEKGFSRGRMTSGFRFSTPARFSATLLPVQVRHVVSSSPARVSSAMTAYTPPARSRSSM